MGKIKVIDKRTGSNPSIDNYGDFVRCCNCGRSMVVDLREDKCPYCKTETLKWEEETNENQEVDEDFFKGNDRYSLVSEEDEDE